MLNTFYLKELFDKELAKASIFEALKKIHPKNIIKNPLLFVVWLIAIFTLSVPFIPVLKEHSAEDPTWFTLLVSCFIWVILVVAYFAEAFAEQRGKLHLKNLQSLRKEYLANKITDEGNITQINSSKLKANDCIIVSAGEFIPCNGYVIQGIASVDESAITGESAPVIRENTIDKSQVAYGTRVLSDSIKIKVTDVPGKELYDRLVTQVEGASSRRTENEIALLYLLSGITFTLAVLCICLIPISIALGLKVSLTMFSALLICIMPTTISALISTISLSGMEKLFNRNIIALNNRALEIAGDIDIVLFDKTGTVTLGNRIASEFIPISKTPYERLILAAEICSILDETIEGRSIISLIKERYGLKLKVEEYKHISFTPFSAETTTSSGVYKSTMYLKGSIQATLNILKNKGISYPKEVNSIAQKIGEEGATPIAILQNDELLGIVKLKDTIKPGMKERFKRLYIMGIKTFMITGDNYHTSKTIAKEAGIEDFICESTPDGKIQFIKEQQALGIVVAMVGDGANDAFPMSHADVSLAMNNGAQETKEASNLIDLDNDPAKIIEVIEVGRQINMTKGCINTFSLFNDLAKYFAILPAIFTPLFPELSKVNIMALHSPYTAILSAVIFNSLIILVMMPLAIKGVRYRAMSATKTARKFLVYFGISGLIAPFIGIKLIDMFIEQLITFLAL